MAKHKVNSHYKIGYFSNLYSDKLQSKDQKKCLNLKKIKKNVQKNSESSFKKRDAKYLSTIWDSKIGDDDDANIFLNYKNLIKKNELYEQQSLSTILHLNVKHKADNVLVKVLVLLWWEEYIPRAFLDELGLLQK